MQNGNSISKGLRRSDPDRPRPLADAVLRLIWDKQRISRAEIARALGISAASVTAITSDLIADGLVGEVAAPPPRDAVRGRPPVGLGITGGAGAVIGLKLSDEAHTAILSDLAGATLATRG